METRILINAVDPQECRIAKVKDNKLEEFHIQNASKEVTQGNIYKGIITHIEPALQAVFVDYGGERHGFLQRNEIHNDYYCDGKNDDDSISSIVKKDQELLVQVIKDPVNKKGGVLTTYISLPGRYVVLMPGSRSKGISRKIEDHDERVRLKEVVDKLSIPEGFGVIIRTAGQTSTKSVISRDLSYLMRLWKNIKSRVMKVNAPALLYREQNLAIRAIRDYFTPDVDEILIDHQAVFKEVKDFINIISPKNTGLVKQYKEDRPLFTKYKIEEQIDSIYSNRVRLKSGGSIVIGQTEALVAIDVNSGKSTQNKSIEQTAYQTNLEAAEEISLQLRLRDLGGLIVIDFIDMRDSKHKKEIEKALKTHLRQDKAKIRIGKISGFGLMEMSRQRLRPSIEFGSFMPCSYCLGRGVIPSTETLGVKFLRRLNIEASKHDISEIKGTVPINVASYLLNKKRKEISDLEGLRGICINIEGSQDMIPGENSVVCIKKGEEV